MRGEKRYKFKTFSNDLQEALGKNKKFDLQYKVELAKLKMAEKLTELRENMGLTQADLARKMNVSQQLISRIESGSDNITIETLIKFLFIMGVILKIDIEKGKKNQEILQFV